MPMTSIFDIVYHYIDLFYHDEKLTKEQKKTIYDSIKTLLKRGWCSADLYKEFKKAYRDGFSGLRATGAVSGRPKVKNLIAPDEFYYHNNLRLTSAPPKRELDYDSGEIVCINEPYFLEMKADYTVDDLIKYYARQTGEKVQAHEMKRLRGSMEWMLKNYTLEHILFMIDVAVNASMADDIPMPYSPLDVQKYAKDALIIRDQKITEAVEARGDKIVRKKRSR